MRIFSPSAKPPEKSFCLGFGAYDGDVRALLDDRRR